MYIVHWEIVGLSWMPLLWLLPNGVLSYLGDLYGGPRAVGCPATFAMVHFWVVSVGDARLAPSLCPLASGACADACSNSMLVLPIRVESCLNSVVASRLTPVVLRTS